ncbi:MAG: SAM-dependent methyltransferase [Desulfuromonas sp.]|nr:MAG: SAM-dependent methyltransferase [Desulfuromonas sp.]
MREDYQPFEIGKTIIIAPPDRVPETDKRILLMERGAFGSGEHETTRSCIEILETLEHRDNCRILDLGSGTGILSIAALQLNPAATAVCIDIEPEAVISCQENCELNGVNERVTHLCGTLDSLSETDFDLILANIYGDILLNVAEGLVAKAKAGAHILLSGILWEYNFDVKQAYRQLGGTLISSRMMSEFCTLLFKKQ